MIEIIDMEQVNAMENLLVGKMQEPQTKELIAKLVTILSLDYHNGITLSALIVLITFLLESIPEVDTRKYSMFTVCKMIGRTSLK